MKTLYYDKLVRDNIPQIIEEEGKKCKCVSLSDDQYKEYLNNKLIEELNEYLNDYSINELADLLEVIYSLAEILGCSKTQLEQIRLDKANKNGSFSKKICLKEVYTDFD